MSDNKKMSKNDPVKNNVNNQTDNKCPVKEGDNCLVPGLFSDSDPITGGG